MMMMMLMLLVLMLMLMLLHMMMMKMMGLMCPAKNVDGQMCQDYSSRLMMLSWLLCPGHGSLSFQEVMNIDSWLWDCLEKIIFEIIQCVLSLNSQIILKVRQIIPCSGINAQVELKATH